MITNRRGVVPLVRVAVALVAGICAGDAMAGVVVPWMWLCALSVAVALSAYAFFRNCNPVVQTMLLLCAVAVCGALRTSVYEHNQKVEFYSNPESYDAVVASAPVAKGGKQRCEAVVATGRFSGRRVYVYMPADCGRLAVGDGLRAKSCFRDVVSESMSRKYSGKDGVGHFDYRRWLGVNGIVARTYLDKGTFKRAVVDLSGLSGVERLRLWLGSFRDRIVARYSGKMRSSDSYAIVAAMTFGDKSLLTEKQRHTYSVSGVSHVLALSGMHLGIIYALLSFLLAGGRHRSFMQAFVLVAVWGYVVMVGMPPSVVRSAVMLSVFSIVSMLSRSYISLNTLAIAALLILGANPLSLWDTGFRLSFLAVLGIVLFQGRLYGMLPSRLLFKHRLLRWCWSMLTVSLSAQILVVPLVAYYFGMFPCYFLLSNFVAIPLATLIIYSSILMYATFFIPFLQTILLGVVGWEVDVLNSSLSWIASLPGSSIDNISMGTMQLVLAYVVIILLCRLFVYGMKMYRSAYGTGH